MINMQIWDIKCRMVLDKAPLCAGELMTCMGHRSVYRGLGEAQTSGFAYLSPFMLLFINVASPKGSQW